MNVLSNIGTQRPESGMVESRVCRAHRLRQARRIFSCRLTLGAESCLSSLSIKLWFLASPKQGPTLARFQSSTDGKEVITLWIFSYEEHDGNPIWRYQLGIANGLQNSPIPRLINALATLVNVWLVSLLWTLVSKPLEKHFLCKNQGMDLIPPESTSMLRKIWGLQMIWGS